MKKEVLHPWTKTQLANSCLCLFFQLGVGFGFSLMISACWFLGRICSAHQEGLIHNLFPDAVPTASITEIHGVGRLVCLSQSRYVALAWGGGGEALILNLPLSPCLSACLSASASSRGVGVFTSCKFIFCTRKLAPGEKRYSLSYLLPHFHCLK